MRIEYDTKWRPTPETEDVIAHADEIARRYARGGMGLTLRQMYYQFVAGGLIENSDKSYKRLGSIVNKARMAGMIDWSHLTDRTRNPHLPYVGDPPSIASVLRTAKYGYGTDKWDGQPFRVEVWVEKEALGEVVQRAASRLACGSLACRGYMSQSEMWEAGQRFTRYIEGGQRVVVLHLGDHDPSGIDMTRDIRDRLTSFIAGNYSSDVHSTPLDQMGWNDDDTGAVDLEMFESAIVSDWLPRTDTEHDFEPHFQVERIALNMDQIRQYQPPPNPAKLSDARGSKYVEEYGTESWELDALPPDVLTNLIQDNIRRWLDVDAFNAQIAREAEVREAIDEAATEIAARYDEEES